MYKFFLTFSLLFQSEGEENPGAVISSYLLTSLDTITGGGAVYIETIFTKCTNNFYLVVR